MKKTSMMMRFNIVSLNVHHFIDIGLNQINTQVIEQFLMKNKVALKFYSCELEGKKVQEPKGGVRKC